MVVDFDFLLAGDEKNKRDEGYEVRGRRILHGSELYIKRDRRHDTEKGILLGFGTGTVLAVLEINEVWVVAVVEIIDAEYPLVGGTAVSLCPDGADIHTVVVGSAVAVALGVVVYPVVLYLVLAAGSRESLTGIEDPRTVEHPALSQPIHRHETDVVPTVVVGIIPSTAVDTRDTGL
jgi:hypothetical protein